MSEIKFDSLKQYILDRSNTSFDPVYLIFGEEFLYKQVAKELLKAIMPDKKKQRHNYEIVSQKEEGNINDIIDRINTYSFFSENKIIELRDATLFVSHYNHANQLSKIKSAYLNDEVSKASKLLLNLMGRLQMDLSELEEGRYADQLNLPEDIQGDLGWISSLVNYCRENNLAVPDMIEDADRLKEAIEKGFPKSSYLFISTDTVDKRRGLYKTIKKFGTIIDCSISHGNRKADRDVQRRFLTRHLQQLIKKNNKQIEPQAFELIYKKTGFDLRSFTSSVEKLIDYTEQRNLITIKDVEQLLVKTKQDPVYELTSAIADRNTLKSIFYLKSLLKSGFHYLQLLTAITNQIRKLTVIKGFIESPHGSSWYQGINYDQFKTNTIDSIRKYDDELSSQFQNYKSTFKSSVQKDSPKNKQKPSSDLIIAKNPKNPYPIYQLFLRSGNYTKSELFRAIETLSTADLKLKTTGQSPVTILEEVIFNICDKR
jgi:DNA polymerase-3 subunit delta